MRDPEYKLKAAAAASIPAGFYFVRSGPILPDDLLFCHTDGYWMPATSPLWDQKTPDDASDCVGVARRPGIDWDPSFAAARRRTYTMPALTEIVVDRPTPKTTLQDPEQRSLF